MKQKGFTLPEVLIGLVVGCIGLGGLLMMMSLLRNGSIKGASLEGPSVTLTAQGLLSNDTRYITPGSLRYVTHDESFTLEYAPYVHKGMPLLEPRTTPSTWSSCPADGGSNGDALNGADGCFKAVGIAPPLTDGQPKWLILDPETQSIYDQDGATHAAALQSVTSDGTESRLEFTPKNFNATAQSKFYTVEDPKSWVCDMGSRTFKVYTHYGIHSSQPNDFTNPPAFSLSNVNSCQIKTYGNVLYVEVNFTYRTIKNRLILNLQEKP